MQLTRSVHIVASGDAGFSLTNAFDCTVYLIDGGAECALIDAGVGVEPERILSEIRTAGVSPERITRILLTHGHGDHAGGAATLSQVCGAQVYAMEPAAGFVARGDLAALSLEKAVAAGVYEPGYTFRACPVLPVADGQRIGVGSLALTVVSSPGHSAGHCCYCLAEDGRRILFAGDAIQCGGKIALQAIWDCDLQQYVRTIHRLAGLHPDALLPGHGCVALQRGWLHLDKAEAALDTLALPKNSIGE